MNLLSVDSLSKQFGDRIILNQISFGIAKGEKVALVGSNGSGKTTLLKLITQNILPDSGGIALRKGIKIGFLNQDLAFDENLTLAETLFNAENPQQKAVREYEKALLAPNNQEILQKALEQMDALQAWEYETQIKQILGKLGLHDLDRKISQLSGGQKKRVALAHLLIDQPDLLILDEPTNHLDLETIEWLEYHLSLSESSLLLVSHDRYFIDRVCQKIIELDRGNLYQYNGNYAYFLEKKAQREINTQIEIDKARNLLRKELEWMRRQPKARGTKSKSRIDNFYKLQDKAQEQKTNASLQIEVKTSRMGNKILELKNISKKFDKQTIIDDFSHNFQKGDKIGIVGKNGVGKSTFLKIITGQLQADSGSLDIGETIQIGYYSQDNLQYNPGQRVIEFIKEIAEVVTLSNGESITASQFLQRFLFSPEVQYKPIEKLSGGEKRRLQLMQVLIKNPNFLILDEPTNDLDIDTLNVLEDFLENFVGCLLLVSHDRYFMDKIVENLLVFEGQGKIKNFNGNYSDYKEYLEEITEVEKVQKESKKQELPKENSQKKKMSFKEQKALELLEKEIQDLEAEKATCIEQMNQIGLSHEKLQEIALRIEKITTTLEEKEMQWLELSE
jgi:ATP-binding cassette subfamily F protein uup